MERKGRFVISSVAVMLTVTIVTALTTLSAGIRGKIGGALREYGANMIVTDGSGKAMETAVVGRIKSMSPYIEDALSQIYGTATIGRTTVEIIGMEPDKMKGFRVDGRLPERTAELMVGINLKDILPVEKGDAVQLNNKDVFKVTAVFERGSDDDSAVVMPIEDAGRLMDMEGVSSLLLNADTRHLEEVKHGIGKNYPFLEVKTLRQVAVAEERILGKIQLLMSMVTLVVLLSSIVALGSTMGANVIERMEEIGLMKAIGATRGDIRDFFMSEALLSGFAGSAAGYGMGIAAAEMVSRTAFGSFIPVNIPVVFVSVLSGVCISVVSTYFPVRDAMKGVPAMILRGE